jgi:integrase
MSIRSRVWTTAKGEQRRWLVDYTDQHGKRRAKQFARKKDADSFQATAKVEVCQGIHVADRATVTVARAAESWITASEARNPPLEKTTLAQRRQHVDLHINPLIGNVKLNMLTTPAVYDFRDRLRAAGRSPAMVRIITTSLHAIMKNAVRRGLASRNPVSDMERTPGTNRKRRLEIGRDIPAPAEIQQLIAALSAFPRWRPCLMTAIFSGLRASELRGLRWCDVDLEHAALHVRQRADRYNQIGRLKTKGGARSIPIGPLLVNTLREWKLRCPCGSLDLVFPDRRGDVMSHWSLIDCGLTPAMIRADLVVVDPEGTVKPKYPGVHALRHFYASWCINRKADGGLELPVKNVSERLGHSNIGLTLNVYSHLFAASDDGGQLAAGEAFLMKSHAT